MKVSIIIPTYNSCERLYLNLLSLNFQDCGYDSYEAVVIDNGSNDGTLEMVKKFSARYKMKYIKIGDNRGRAYARNLGVWNSSGSILVFNDGDMINAADFVSSHIKEHETKDRIVCGYGWRRVYSYYYSGFKGYLRSNFMKQKKNYCINGRSLRSKNICMLISEEEIRNNDFLNYSFFLDGRQNKVSDVIKEFGYEMKDYCFPWRFFMTCNCSLERTAFENSGGFDEKYDGWGYEDIDLGYRLYKKGYCFRLAPGCVSTHQEHPIDLQDTFNNNLYYFLDKYNSIDQYLFYYGKILGSDSKVNRIAVEVKELEASGKYEDVLLDFLNMLKAFRALGMHAGKPGMHKEIKVKLKQEKSIDAPYFLSAYKDLYVLTSGKRRQ